MGQNAGVNSKTKNKEKKQRTEDDAVKREKENEEEEEEGEEQDCVSVHSRSKPLNSSLRNEDSEVDLELKLLEALEIYPPAKLRGVHRHFVLYGLTEYLRRSFSRHFTPDDVLKLLDRFYNLEMIKPDDEDMEILNQEEEFCLPQSYFVKEEP